MEALPNPSLTVVDGLGVAPLALDEAGALLPREPGVYAWWAKPETFAELPGTVNPTDQRYRLLYVGIATNLNHRIRRNHLARSGSSTLRRTLAGLLLPTEHWETRRTDRVVLVPAAELRLTAWMHEHLRLTWYACEDPRPHELRLITALCPPLNFEGVPPGPTRDRVKAAKAAYAASAVH
ncbi:MAG: GIY-YIG nuclease family protein [Hamadaea sp.]|nr:GIY-YIG nuclease family protein [Hamadaea sp.]